MNSVDKIVIEALWKFSRDGASQVRPKGLVERIQKKTGLSGLDIGLSFSSLQVEGLITCKSWLSQPTRPGAMLTVTPPEREVPKWQERWVGCLSRHPFTDEERQALIPFGAELEGCNEGELHSFLRGLLKLREDQDSLQGQREYDVSARYLLGSSKLLSHLRKAAVKLGMQLSGLAPSPRYLIVAGPENPSSVLLVENPHSFELCIESGLANTAAIISVYGYGLASSARKAGGSPWEETVGQSWSSIVPLVRAGTPPDLIELFRHPQLFWWGDLDLSGMRIFDSLKQLFGQLRLSALYEPMLQALERGCSHPYCKAVGKEGQLVQEARRPFKDDMAREVAGICAERAVDQEYVQEGFKDLGGRGLEL